jgi:hypothetical protein
MNIHKLEDILHEMERADFQDLTAAQGRVREWAERISSAITEHLMAEIGGGPKAIPPPLSSEPGGHDWDQ